MHLPALYTIRSTLILLSPPDSNLPVVQRPLMVSRIPLKARNRRPSRNMNQQEEPKFQPTNSVCTRPPNIPRTVYPPWEHSTRRSSHSPLMFQTSPCMRNHRDIFVLLSFPSEFFFPGHGHSTWVLLPWSITSLLHSEAKVSRHSSHPP